MTLNEDLTQLLNKKYEPSARIYLKFKGKDVTVKIDKNGECRVSVRWTKKENGDIKGKRYARTLKFDRNGKIIKVHWELKGRAT